MSDDSPFEARFHAKIVGGTYPGDQLYYFTWSDNRTSGIDELLVRVEPKCGPAWVGVFKRGQFGNVLSDVCATPDPDRVCVVANGAGYIVNALKPTEYVLVPLSPVLSVFVCAAAQTLALADFTEIAGVQADGTCWSTRRLSYDGLRKLGLRDTRLRGEGWNAPRDTWIPFEVDLRTGACDGGAFP